MLNVRSRVVIGSAVLVLVGLMSFAGLSDEQVWQLIHYVRSLAK